MKNALIIVVLLFGSCDLLPCDNRFIVTNSSSSSNNRVEYKIVSIKGKQTIFLYEKPGIFNVGDTLTINLKK